MPDPELDDRVIFFRIGIILNGLTVKIDGTLVIFFPVTLVCFSE